MQGGTAESWERTKGEITEEEDVEPQLPWAKAWFEVQSILQ
jgi:hypothetical protein